ncbi:MAG: ribose-5-phosphate isomerase RpiA [Gemmatimonadetes bacterium]|nr:ribose-5-phosphate isomerase RpiA [Gemmatimonadota bacterium]
MKSMAGRAAALSVASGMRLGLGTGSTVAHFLEHLGARMARGELSGVVGVPTSVRTEKAARRLGIALAALEEVGTLDLTVDGADEVEPGLDLVKGLGGALLREKMVAQSSARMLVIVDDSKLVGRLGEIAPVPVEVVPFGHASHMGWLKDLGAEPRVRDGSNGRPYRTDNGNLIVDCRFPGGIEDPAGLERRLARRAGVVESGLFLEMATEAVVAGAGGVRRMKRGVQ